MRKKDTGRIYAMKVLTKSNVVKRKQIEHTKTERRVLGYSVHPFIVTMHYAFQTAEKLYFVVYSHYTNTHTPYSHTKPPHTHSFHWPSTCNKPRVYNTHTNTYTPYLQLDYCSGGEIFFHLGKAGKFSEDLSKLYAAEIVLALDHLHQ